MDGLHVLVSALHILVSALHLLVSALHILVSALHILVSARLVSLPLGRASPLPLEFACWTAARSQSHPLDGATAPGKLAWRPEGRHLRPADGTKRPEP